MPSRCGLAQVKKKILVLDLDETLIHSHHDGVLRPTVRPGTPPDFILKVCEAMKYLRLLLCPDINSFSVLRVRAWQDLAPGSARRRKAGGRHGARSVWWCLGCPSSFPVPLQVVIDKHPVRFFVHKRPHVDFFLEVVSV